MYDIVFAGDFTPSQHEAIAREFAHHSVDRTIGDPVLRQAVTGLITRSNHRIDEALVAQFPALKVIATCGVGYDGIPLALARQGGIVVTNTPGVLDGAVSELGIGILLGLLRKLPAADRFVRDGRWPTSTFPFTTSLEGKTVGIVGMGRVGRGIAHRLVAFGVTIAYCGTAKSDLPYRHMASLPDLATLSDVLFVCCPGGEATRNLIDRPILEALGANGILINLARGSVVDEAALISALESGVIKGAGLDVYASEPHVPPALCALDNTLLVPHLGSATQETRAAMLRLTLDNLHAVLGGRPALTPVF